MKGTLPAWFRQKAPESNPMLEIQGLLERLSLHTICDSAACPNIGRCFSSGTATFLILGPVCTRNCTFCAVSKGKPSPVDEDEPLHLLEAVQELGLRHVVVTSVTRDDLADGGASQFARVIRILHASAAGVSVEVLIPDFQGQTGPLEQVVADHPEVLNHNVETVPRLYPEVRPMAVYDRSIVLLSEAKRLDSRIVTKSGLMLGLGETREEVSEVMDDLREAGCDLLTIGQYLRPSPRHHPVVRYVSPDEFAEYEQMASRAGFAGVASGPLIRSSFKAAELYSGN
jgi:lipoyl synthase